MVVIKNVFSSRYRLWYMFCFFSLGILDQMICSADGRIQMSATNCVGIAIAALLIPALNIEKFRNKVYLFWTIFSIALGLIVGMWGWQNWAYKGQWITGILNVFVWGYLVIYLVRERNALCIFQRMKQPFFICLLLMFFLMLFSRHMSILPLWMLLIFGGFYLFGVPKHLREDYLHGLLNGIILWFFVLQILAFGFRPYDYVRYRGFYRGETQNGIFYMMAYCAFLCKWILAKKRGAGPIVRGIFFLLSAASISFLLFTGGRSSLMGVAAVTLLSYLYYDVIYRKTLWRLFCHFVLLAGCVVLLFPVVYGAIRYLPAILHHPIWFAGEYSEYGSVRSFDPWNSDRYISFDEAVETNIGRILLMFGIDINKAGNIEVRNPWVLKAYASTRISPGVDSENPYVSSQINESSTIEIRKYIYEYYFSHLNLLGHSKEEGGFYLTSNNYVPHAHNLLLQMAYDYGILCGLLFIGIIIWCYIRLIKWERRGAMQGSWILLIFLTAIVVYGMTELALRPGMMTWVMLYLCLCFDGGKEKAPFNEITDR